MMSLGPPSAATIAPKRSAAAPERSASSGSRSPMPPRSSSARVSASVTSTSRGSASSGSVEDLDRLADLQRVAGGRAEHLVHVGQQRDGRQPGGDRDVHERPRERARVVVVGHERAVAVLDVHHQPAEPGRELLGQDRGDDQRDRLDAARRVADPVQLAIGGREVVGLAADHAADLADDARPSAARRASRCSRGSPPACPACRRCGRGRGRRSSASRRRTRRSAARGSATPCPPRRRSSACRAPACRRRTSPGPCRCRACRA